MRIHPGYRARDDDRNNILRLQARLFEMKARIQKQKDFPIWMILELDSMIELSNWLIRPLTEHRDEQPQWLPEVGR